MKQLFEKLRGVFGIGSSQSNPLSKLYDFDQPWIEGSGGKFTSIAHLDTRERFGLKVVNSSKLKSYRDRFKGLNFPTEGAVAKEVAHKCIVKFIEKGDFGGGDEYILTEYVEGPLLKNLINDRASLIENHGVKLIKYIAHGLKAVHDAGFMHGDFSPKNILFDKNQKLPKLFDFGLSLPDLPDFHLPKTRASNSHYMAPEILRRKPSDRRADIFAFGIVAFQLCTFQHPWGTDTMFDSKQPADLRELNPKVNKQLADAIHECLVVNPDERCPHIKRFLSSAGF